jgi:hypothetical protein
MRVENFHVSHHSFLRMSRQIAPVCDETLGCQIFVSKLIFGGSKGYLAKRERRGEREREDGGALLGRGGGTLVAKKELGRGGSSRGRKLYVDEELSSIVWSPGRTRDLEGARSRIQFECVEAGVLIHGHTNRPTYKPHKDNHKDSFPRRSLSGSGVPHQD